jgi:hypothetical protein
MEGNMTPGLPKVSAAILVTLLATSACGDLVIEPGVPQGARLQTADAATASALDTEIAIGEHPVTIELLDVSLTAYSCSPHADSSGYDCTYTADFIVAYEVVDWGRIQCFFSRSESEKVNAEPGAGSVTITVTHEDLVFPPGTTFYGFCQLRDQATDELLSQAGSAELGWDIEVPAP